MQTKELQQEFKKLHRRLDGIETNMVTKAELKVAIGSQTDELKEYVEDQIEGLAQIIAKTVAEPLDRHIQATEVDTDMGVRVWHSQKMIGKARK